MKKILSLLLVLVFCLGIFASCGMESVEGKTYVVSKVSFSFNKDASTEEKYEFLRAVRILSDNENMSEAKAIKWTEKLVLDLCKNYKAEFKNGKVTENFFEISSSMVKETDGAKIELKKEALRILASKIFNLTLDVKNPNGEIIGSTYDLTIDGNGMKAKRTGVADTVFVFSGYARYIQVSVDNDHPQNNNDSFIAQAFNKNDTIKYRGNKLKQTIEKDGFVINLTYKKK